MTATPLPDPTPPGPALPPTAGGPPAPNPWATWGQNQQPYSPYRDPAFPGGPRPPVYPDPPSKKMAGWALALAILQCCFPVGWLVSIGLAITVLIRGRDGREHGKGLAISALVVDALWVVVFVVAVVAGVFQDLTEEGDRDASGRVTSEQEISFLKVKVGDCINYPALAGEDAADQLTVTAIPCAEPHQFEAYHDFTLEDGSYPGEDEVQRLADAGCAGAFSDFVGTPYRRSRLYSYFIYPTATSWRLMNDHTVTCLVGRDGHQTTGTLEGSRR